METILPGDEKKLETSLPGNDDLLKRIEKLDKQITEEVLKETIDKKMLAILTRQRNLVFETLEANGVDLSGKGILKTDLMIEKLLSDALTQETTTNSRKSTRENPKGFEKLDARRREIDEPLDDYIPKYTRMDDEFNPEIPGDNLYRGAKISYPSQNEIEYNVGPDGSIIVSTAEGKKYVTDPEGNDLFEGEFDEIIRTENGYIVKKYKKRGVYDTKGNKIIEINYDSITQIKGGYKVKNSFGFGIILNNGERLIIPKYQDIKEIEGGYKVKRKGKWGVVDLNGKEIIAPEYDSIEVNGDSYECKKGEIVDKICIPRK